MGERCERERLRHDRVHQLRTVCYNEHFLLGNTLYLLWHSMNKGAKLDLRSTNLIGMFQNTTVKNFGDQIIQSFFGGGQIVFRLVIYDGRRLVLISDVCVREREREREF